MSAAENISRNASLSVLLLEAGPPSYVISGGDAFPPYTYEATLFEIPGE